MRILSPPLAAALVLACAVPVHAQIYADFHTSLGTFTCELEYEKAPKAVANFIGLAEGSRAWIDPATGSVQSGKSFYEGVTFHRVIPNFMSQAGSRNGLGTDGPGYRFPDETENGLTHQKYSLSMANSGRHTNGSQFFITSAVTDWLDGVHTVFGRATAGHDVIDAINSVPTTAADRPQTPVTISSIAIRREGPAAAAFDPHAQNLAVVSPLPGALQVVPGEASRFQLQSSHPPGSVIQAFRSQDLRNWTPLREFHQGTGAQGNVSLDLDDANLASRPRAFYHLSLASYPDAISPASLAGRTLTVRFATQSLAIQFDAPGTGGTIHYSLIPAPQTITAVSYTPSPYAPSWILSSIPDLPPLRIMAALEPPEGPLISGSHTLYQWNGISWSSVGSGTLTLTN